MGNYEQPAVREAIIDIPTQHLCDWLRGGRVGKVTLHLKPTEEMDDDTPLLTVPCPGDIRILSERMPRQAIGCLSVVGESEMFGAVGPQQDRPRWVVGVMEAVTALRGPIPPPAG